jgi:hypothetical protein
MRYDPASSPQRGAARMPAARYSPLRLSFAATKPPPMQRTAPSTGRSADGVWGLAQPARMAQVMTAARIFMWLMLGAQALRVTPMIMGAARC